MRPSDLQSGGDMRADRTLSAPSQCLPTQFFSGSWGPYCYLPRVILSFSSHLETLESIRMVIYFTYRLLFAYFAFPGILLGELAFRCPSCTAESLAACPEVTATCTEIVREPGCGCCPLCARLEGELCGVYTPRCSSGLMCYPSTEFELPLQQLIQGLGRCGQKVDLEATTSLDHQATNGKFFQEKSFERGKLKAVFFF